MHPSPDQHWSEIYGQGRDFLLSNSRDITTFLSYADPKAPKTSLDIGCGTGQLTRELFHRGYQCTGLDVSSRAVEIARSLTTVPTDQLSYLHANVEHDESLGLPHATYGLITCRLVFAFIKNPKVFLGRVSSLLAHDGIFVVVTPLLEDVPTEKKNIAADPKAIALLPEYFDEVARYKEAGLTYFVGKPIKPQ